MAASSMIDAIHPTLCKLHLFVCNLKGNHRGPLPMLVLGILNIPCFKKLVGMQGLRQCKFKYFA